MCGFLRMCANGQMPCAGGCRVSPAKTICQRAWHAPPTRYLKIIVVVVAVCDVCSACTLQSRHGAASPPHHSHARPTMGVWRKLMAVQTEFNNGFSHPTRNSNVHVQ